MDGIHTYVTGVARGGAQPAHWAARQDDRASATNFYLPSKTIYLTFSADAMRIK